MTVRISDVATAGAAAAIATNVVPHLAHGISGKPFPTPFADPPGVGDSSPASNIVWASMNATVAALLVYTGRSRLRDPACLAVAAVSAAGSAVGLRSYFRKVRPNGGSVA
ncbi:hypothetical protein VZC37_07340 [Gordonia sp. LSe1-13]|uniref:Uncharacterized protein n=1 Tax=Gordonia sesuvii TaxID=3116777 RepID=A0ABU7MAL5_9ACTN|nr:hypothetical protein [Gordonia sp. LSe1-13]